MAALAELVGLAGTLAVVALLVLGAVLLITAVFLAVLAMLALSTRGNLRAYFADQERWRLRFARPLRAVLRH